MRTEKEDIGIMNTIDGVFALVFYFLKVFKTYTIKKIYLDDQSDEEEIQKEANQANAPEMQNINAIDNADDENEEWEYYYEDAELPKKEVVLRFFAKLTF